MSTVTATYPPIEIRWADRWLLDGWTFDMYGNPPRSPAARRSRIVSRRKARGWR